MRGLLAGVVVLAMAGAAQAQTIITGFSPAPVSAMWSINDTNGSAEGPHTVTYGAGTSGKVNISGSPEGRVEADATRAAGDTTTLDVSASLTYDMAIKFNTAYAAQQFVAYSGSNTNLPPLEIGNIGGFYNISGSQNSFGSITASIGSQVYNSCNSGLYGNCSATTPWSLPIYATPYVCPGPGNCSAVVGMAVPLATVTLTAHAQAYDGVDFATQLDVGDYARVMLDPQFTFTQQFFTTTGIDPRDVSLVLSEGVMNGVPGVPEPAAWALMTVGLGLAGAALRRQRKLAIAA